eukprot:13000282-Alexandrium_andersonii.AAC.1
MSRRTLVGTSKQLSGTFRRVQAGVQTLPSAFRQLFSDTIRGIARQLSDTSRHSQALHGCFGRRPITPKKLRKCWRVCESSSRCCAGQ